jgi:hypothetical protein
MPSVRSRQSAIAGFQVGSKALSRIDCRLAHNMFATSCSEHTSEIPHKIPRFDDCCGLFVFLRLKERHKGLDWRLDPRELKVIQEKLLQKTRRATPLA